MPLETTKFDIAEYLDSEERISAYLNQVLLDGDAAEFAVALGDVARARGMSRIAQESGLSREALYRALSETGNPTLSTLRGVLHALGLRLSVMPIASPTHEAA